jgi:hypothetical protein
MRVVSLSAVKTVVMTLPLSALLCAVGTLDQSPEFTTYQTMFQVTGSVCDYFESNVRQVGLGIGRIPDSNITVGFYNGSSCACTETSCSTRITVTTVACLASHNALTKTLFNFQGVYRVGNTIKFPGTIDVPCHCEPTIVTDGGRVEVLNYGENEHHCWGLQCLSNDMALSFVDEFNVERALSNPLIDEEIPVDYVTAEEATEDLDEGVLADYIVLRSDGKESKYWGVESPGTVQISDAKTVTLDFFSNDVVDVYYDSNRLRINGPTTGFTAKLECGALPANKVDETMSIGAWVWVIASLTALALGLVLVYNMCEPPKPPPKNELELSILGSYM